MTGQLAALIFLSTFSQIQPAEVPQQSRLVVAEVGGNVTLQCPVSAEEGKFFNWYKQSLGYMVQTVASGSYDQKTLHGQFNSSHFTITGKESEYILTIRNVTKEDEATYFCQTGTAYSQTFSSGIFLAVNAQNRQKSVHVKQSPKSESVQPGDSVTLQCALHSKNKENCVQCQGEHSVYWFRPGPEGSHPSIIYSHQSSSDEHEERSCAYSLSKTIQDSSDAGTYYCAVFTCGQILFGEGTNVETQYKLEPALIALGVLLACCVTVIAVLIYYVNRKRVCEHCKGAMNASLNPGHDKLAVDQSNNLDDAETVNYVALDFSARRVKKGKRKRDSPEECVYSDVRAEYHTKH